jgi:hypothetical protein
MISSSVASGLSITSASASAISVRLCGGISVAMPTAMPDAPLSRRLGTTEGRITGSCSVSS